MFSNCRITFLSAAGALLCGLCVTPIHAQQWEIGALGGPSLSMERSISSADGGAGSVGLKPGFAVGGWLGHGGPGRFSGEVRYLFERNDIRLTSGGASYSFASQSHLVHYDVLVHAGSVESRVRPFVAAGVGIRGFSGTGQERAVQPLSQFAILSRTSQWQPVFSVGGGFKWVIGRRMTFRAEVRDYMTAAPSQVIVPGAGSSLKGWLHNLTPMIGIGYSF